MFTDREIINTSDRDQRKATVTDAARDIGVFYAELLATGVPKDLAKSLTKTFAVTVVFIGCGCEVD